jgi:hypothetical protein
MRSTSSRLHLSARNMMKLMNPETNPDYGTTPTKAMDRLGINWTPKMEPVFDSKGNALPGCNNIVAPDGRSLGISGDRYLPAGAPKLASIAEGILKMPKTKMLAAWTLNGGGKFGFRLLVGDVKPITKNVGDEIARVIDLFGGSDNATCWAIRQSVVRLICSNGMTAGIDEFVSMGRNTLNSDFRINDAAIRMISNLNEKNLTYMDDLAALAEKPLSEMELRKFFEDYAKKVEEKKNRADQLVQDLLTLMRSDTQRMALDDMGRATKWTAFNAVSELNMYGSFRTQEASFLHGLNQGYVENNAIAYEMLAA